MESLFKNMYIARGLRHVRCCYTAVCVYIVVYMLLYHLWGSVRVRTVRARESSINNMRMRTRANAFAQPFAGCGWAKNQSASLRRAEQAYEFTNQGTRSAGAP